MSATRAPNSHREERRVDGLSLRYVHLRRRGVVRQRARLLEAAWAFSPIARVAFARLSSGLGYNASRGGLPSGAAGASVRA